jgi:hypothetical protein
MGALLLPAATAKDPAPVKTYPIDVGGTRVQIVIPAGYVDGLSVSDDMRHLASVMTAPGNRLLAMFVLAEVAKTARAGGIPDLQRYFMVQVPKRGATGSITPSEFLELRGLLRKREKEIYDEQLAAINKDMQKSGEALGKRHGAEDFSMQVAKPRSLGIFDEGDRWITAGGWARLNATTTNSSESIPFVWTASFVHLGDKLVFMYVYDDYKRRDHSWVKNTTKQWVAATLAANR